MGIFASICPSVSFLGYNSFLYLIFMDIQNLQAFAAVAELGSFSAAARKLGKAQSSVSALIQNLEIDLGLTLFDRSSRNPRLSQEGAAILRDV